MSVMMKIIMIIEDLKMDMRLYFNIRFSCNDGITLPLGVADAIRTSLGPKGMDKMVNNNEQN